ncbi:hypothetical protein ACFIOY_20140 [Bradyrhizobium sp. TZ2]
MKIKATISLDWLHGLSSGEIAMTVKELIVRLQALPDQDPLVIIASGNLNDGCQPLASLSAAFHRHLQTRISSCQGTILAWKSSTASLAKRKSANVDHDLTQALRASHFGKLALALQAGRPEPTLIDEERQRLEQSRAQRIGPVACPWK